MVDRPNRCVLLTGASSGLGLATARRLLKSEHRLILTARARSLARFADAGIVESDRVWLRPLDVTNDGERRAVVHEALERWDGVDVLINNAGVAYRSVVEHVREEDRLAQMDINFLAPMELARLVLPHMRHKRAGHIINVSSVGGMMAMPTMGVYSASKFALEGATEALWYEVRPWDIQVTLVEPGFIQSSVLRSERFTGMSEHSMTHPDDPYHCHYEHMMSFIGRVMGLAPATPESVARTILRTMNRKNPPLRVSATVDAFFFSLLRRVMPRRLYHWVLYRSLPGIRTWGPDSPAQLPDNAG